METSPFGFRGFEQHVSKVKNISRRSILKSLGVTGSRCTRRTSTIATIIRI